MDFGIVIDSIWRLWVRLMSLQITIWGLPVNGLGVLYASLAIIMFSVIVFYFGGD